MYEKIAAAAQLAQLQTGDVLSRRQDGVTDDFEIRAVNQRTQMLSLVQADAATLISPAPGDIRRMFIHPQQLITEQTWWTDAAENTRQRQ